MEESFDPRPQYQPMAPTPSVPTPTPKEQSWGAVFSIVIILLMIVVGAFYAWGKRIAEEHGLNKTASTTSIIN